MWMITSCTMVVDSRTVPADLKNCYENVRRNAVQSRIHSVKESWSLTNTRLPVTTGCA
jgi:hypothetical protein